MSKSNRKANIKKTPADWPQARGSSAPSSSTTSQTAIVIAIVGCALLGSQIYSPSATKAASGKSTTVSWLGAPSAEEADIEHTVLSKVPAGGRPEWFPPQRGLNVLKQVGNGTVHFWRHADPDSLSTLTLPDTSLSAVREYLEPHMDMNRPPAHLAHLKQPWQFFDASHGPNHGRVIHSLAELKATRLVLAVEGGQWVWPGVSVGHQQTVPGVTIDGQPMVLKTLSMIPLVFSISGFLTHAECDIIVAEGKDKVEASPVALMDHDKGKAATEWRTSSQVWMGASQLPAGIKERTAAMLRVPIENQETHVQFLRYNHGQKYDAHNDFFDMEFYKNQPDVVKSYDHGYKNRLSTTFWYLNTVANGGETQFPRAGGKPPISDFVTCQGLRVKPVKGKVILFYSLLPSGDYDQYSLHGGCPVLGEKKETKFAANQWTWNKAM